MDTARVNAWDLPHYRFKCAKDAGREKHLAFVTYGGIGDVLCSEPTVRYALENFVSAGLAEKIYVVTRFPEIFSHLDVEVIEVAPDGKIELEGGRGQYHFLYCGHPEGNLQHMFFTHNNMLPVDYPALSALRLQLPLKYRPVQCKVSDTSLEVSSDMVYVHAGAHWKSKRFPTEWWDEVLNQLADCGLIPVLIGGPPTEDQSNPGTVNVNPSGCLDLRGKLSIADSAEHLSKAKVLLTNDSFPLHLATIGGAHIGFFATAKSPEYLMHYRHTDDGIQLGWRMENLARGGAYERTLLPNAEMNHLSVATQEELAKWLPHPKLVAEWAKQNVEKR